MPSPSVVPWEGREMHTLGSRSLHPRGQYRGRGDLEPRASLHTPEGTPRAWVSQGTHWVYVRGF